MNIKAEKLRLIEWLLNVEDQSVIEKLKWLKENKTDVDDWWDEISDAERTSIDRGLEDLKNGRVTPHEKVKKKYEKWL
nr:hypothetical protein [Saprospiraceae bacterium]